VFEQLLDQAPAAGDEDVAVDLLLQLCDLLRDVPGPVDHRGVVPLRVLDRGGDEVLGHLVHALRKLAELALHAFSPGPGAGEALIGDPTDQLRLGAEELFALELAAVVAAVERERPALVLELLAAGRLHHAVHRDEFGHGDGSHRSSCSISAAGCTIFNQTVERSSAVYEPCLLMSSATPSPPSPTRPGGRSLRSSPRVRRP
jgi:hypothetical protein